MLLSSLNCIYNLLNLLYLMINFFFFINFSANLFVLSSFLEKKFFLSCSFTASLLKFLPYLLLMLHTSNASADPAPSSSLSCFKSDSPVMSFLTYYLESGCLTVIHISSTVWSNCPSYCLVHLDAVVAKLILLINSYIVLSTTETMTCYLGSCFLFSSSGENNTCLNLIIRIIGGSLFFTPSLILLSKSIHVLLTSTNSIHNRLEYLICFFVFVYIMPFTVTITSISICLVTGYYVGTIFSMMIYCKIFLMLLLLVAILRILSLLLMRYLLILSSNDLCLLLGLHTL